MPLVYFNLLLTSNHSRSHYAMPYDSTEGFTYKEQSIILGIILMFALYVIFRIKKNLKGKKNR